MIFSLPANASDQGAINKANADIMRCYAQNISALDDGVSDASVVARAVVSGCSSLIQQTVSIVIQNPRADKAEIIRRVQANGLDIVTSQVLKERANSR